MESDWARGQRGAVCAQEAGRSLEIAEPRSKGLHISMCAVCNTWAFLQLQGAVRTVLQGGPWVSFNSTAFSELNEGGTMLWLWQGHRMLSSLPSSWSQASDLISWKLEKKPMSSLVKHEIESPVSWWLDSYLCGLIQGYCHWDVQTKVSQLAEPAPLQLTWVSRLHKGWWPSCLNQSVKWRYQQGIPRDIKGSTSCIRVNLILKSLQDR